MSLFFRISTAPPNSLDDGGSGMSYYCDIYENAEWKNYDVFSHISKTILSRLNDDYMSSYIVVAGQDKETGLLICYRDDDEGVMYCSIDHAGRPSCEPAANEALWHAANAAADLPNGHRLPRLALPTTSA